MQVTCAKLTNRALMNRACSMTSGREANVPLGKMYLAEHSPIRTQLFWIEMEDIPTFVSVHLVRHKIGVEHFVRSNREDRGGNGEATRMTPVNHAMLINAQALITMSRKRLCGKAHPTTREVMRRIKDAVRGCDPDLAEHMVRECEYRGFCTELQSCMYWMEGEDANPD